MGHERTYTTAEELLAKLRAARADEWLEKVECRDWRRRLEAMTRDTIVVAMAERDGDDSPFVFSALLRRSATRHRRVLADCLWDIDQGIGMPGIVQSHVGKGEWLWHYDDGRRERSRRCGVWFRPFVHSRYFDGPQDPRFDLVQEFELFHQACWAGDELEWYDDAGDAHVIARRFQNDERRGVEVPAHHLRDFLAAKGMTLVRFVELQRRLPIEPQPFADDEQYVVRAQSDTSASELFVGGDCASLGREKKRTWITLYSKELIFGYEKPSPRFFGEDEDGLEEFAVGRDEEGQELLLPCKHGTRDHLRPVLFRREVLSRYYNEPSKFKVEHRQVRCQALWSIRFEELDDKTIGAYLGDLGLLPRKEQRHWRNYNLPLEGRISHERYQTDILGEWPTDVSPDPPHDLREALCAASAAGAAIIGSPLFRPLGADDQHLLDGLHVPVTEETGEFDVQTTALAKMIADSIDVAAISKHSCLTIDRDKILGSVGLTRFGGRSTYAASVILAAARSYSAGLT